MRVDIPDEVARDFCASQNPDHYLRRRATRELAQIIGRELRELDEVDWLALSLVEAFSDEDVDEGTVLTFGRVPDLGGVSVVVARGSLQLEKIFTDEELRTIVDLHILARATLEEFESYLGT